MGKTNIEKRKLTHAALDLFFDKNYTQKKAAQEFGLSNYYIQTELYDHRVCYHPHCTEGHPCRAAKRGSNGVMFCGALVDTDFGFDNCPFFKTKEDFDFEFRLTNEMNEMEIKALGY